MEFAANLFTNWGLDTIPMWTLLGGLFLLLVSGELVVWVLNHLEKYDFGSVHLGTLFTPLCTGFPNLMLGIFGGKRISGDLVLHLNIGNNIANATLVVGMLLFICGPLVIRTGRGKMAQKEHTNFGLIFLFFWLGAIATCYLTMDGRITRIDGLTLVLVYCCFQWFLFHRRGRPTKKKQFSKPTAAFLLAILILAAILIAISIEAIALGMQTFEANIPGASLGMFLGLLTVLPETFLLLRLAKRKGSLGLSGLVGDCLVSIPLVIGVAALISPVITAPINSLGDASAIPFLNLALAMAALSLLALRERPLPRWLGLIFIGIYALIWWLSQTG